MASPSGGDGDSELILHRWPSAWGLPSLSPECVAVEAYLRLAGLRFACEDCKTPYASPSGQLPALDQCADIVGEDAGSKDAAARDHTGALAARRIADHLAKKVANLDAHLSSATDRAHLAAYLALVESKLATATAHYTWIDRDRFSAHTREAYGAAFPAPLSYIIPWLWRRRAAKRLGAPLGGVEDAAVRAGAADAYAALSVFLRERGGDAFMFGPKPTSLDAVAFAHLSFHALAPVGDALRDELKKHPNLIAYVERVRRATFPDQSGNGGTGGGAMDAIDSSKWLDPPTTGSGRRRGWWGYGGDGSRGSAGGEKEPLKKKPRSAKEIRFRRRSRWSIAIAVAAVASYLLTGELITFVFSEEGEEEREVREGAAEAVGDAEEEVELEEPLDDDDAEEPPPEAEEE